MSKGTHYETLALHAGWRADPTTGAVQPPIYQTTSFQFRDTEHASKLFALEELGPLYTRIGNPTNDVLNNAWPRWKAAQRSGCGIRSGRYGAGGSESGTRWR